MRELVAFAVALCIAAAPPSYLAARRAYGDVRYDDAEALLYRAISEAQDDKAFIDIYELLATIHLVRNREQRAVDAMSELLARVPTYVPGASDSPKIWESYRKARRETLAKADREREALAALEAEREKARRASQISMAPAPPPAETRWYAKPWVWVGVGVLVAAGTTFALVRYSHPSAPDGDFGPVRLE